MANHRDAAPVTPWAWRASAETVSAAGNGLRMGVLALQGDFLEHEQALARLGAEPVPVRLPRDLDEVDALIIPGGESTTIAMLLDLHGLRTPVQERAAAGMPVWGTCAGMILVARAIDGRGPEPLGLIDITVARNAYGRQRQSFEAGLESPALGEPPFPGVFIRAPRVTALGPGVETLAQLPGGAPVAVRQGSVLATSFHPELTPDGRLHTLFLEMAAAQRGAAIGAA